METISTAHRLAQALKELAAVVQENEALKWHVKELEAQITPSSADQGPQCVRLVKADGAQFDREERAAMEKLREENASLRRQLDVAVGSVAALEKEVSALGAATKRAEAEQNARISEVRDQLTRSHRADMLSLQQQMGEAERKFAITIRQLQEEKNTLLARIQLQPALQQPQSQPPPSPSSGGDSASQFRLQIARLQEENESLRSKTNSASGPQGVCGISLHSSLPFDGTPPRSNKIPRLPSASPRVCGFRQPSPSPASSPKTSPKPFLVTPARLTPQGR